MLCESRGKVGLLGSSFFFGILLGLLFVPRLADVYGRKYPFLGTMAFSCLVQVGLLYCTSLNLAILLMASLGMTFPGKMIVGLNYLLEFTLDEYRQLTITTMFFTDIMLVLFTLVWYEYFRGW